MFQTFYLSDQTHYKLVIHTSFKSENPILTITVPVDLELWQESQVHILGDQDSLDLVKLVSYFEIHNDRIPQHTAKHISDSIAFECNLQLLEPQDLGRSEHGVRVFYSDFELNLDHDQEWVINK